MLAIKSHWFKTINIFRLVIIVSLYLFILNAIIYEMRLGLFKISSYQLLRIKQIQKNIIQRGRTAMEPEIKNKYQVLIIGAGPAGIGAARTLQDAHCPYLILEARNRTCGRVYGVDLDGIRVDLGASWVHSYGSCNPIKPYVKKYCWKPAQLTNTHIGRSYLDGEKGTTLKCTDLDMGHFYQQNFFELAQNTARQSENDTSLYEGGKSILKQLDGKTPEVRRAATLIMNMTEHYEASSLKDLSARHYEYRKDKGGDFAPSKGYHSLLKKISEGLNIELNKIVVSIQRTKEIIRVKCKDGTIYQAKKVLSSLPLGVLKKGVVKFQPQLPEKYQSAIKNLGVGVMNKILLSFEKNFWGPTRWISIAFDERGKFPHFYNFSQGGRNILCCFITDDFALKCQKLQNKEIIDDLVHCFEKIYKKQNVKLRDAVVTKWASEQFSCGSYTSFHVGSTPNDSYLLRKPIEDQLWIIGQHCYAEHIGTAHGAFNTGKCAATQALEFMKWIDPVKEEKKKQYSQKQVTPKNFPKQKNLKKK